MTDKTKPGCGTDGCACDSTTPATKPTTQKAVAIKPAGKRPAKEAKAEPKTAPKAPALETAAPATPATPAQPAPDTATTAASKATPVAAGTSPAAPKAAESAPARAPHGFGARTKTGHYAKLTKSEKYNLVWLGKYAVAIFAIVMAILLVYNFGTRFNAWVFTPTHHTRVHHGHHGHGPATPPASGGHKATPPAAGGTTPGTGNHAGQGTDNNGTQGSAAPDEAGDLGAGAPGPYICTHGRTPEQPVSMQRNCLFRLYNLDHTVTRIFDFDSRWIVLVGDDNPAFGPAVAYNSATGRLYEVAGGAAHVGRRRLWKDMSAAQKASFSQMCRVHYIFPSDCP